MKLAAVVVCYGYPNEKLYHNIQNYIDHIDCLFIWDNTPILQTVVSQDFWDKYKKVKILRTGKNEGIGYALNRGCIEAMKFGCTHILAMDQDSVWEDFVSYRSYVDSDNTQDIAIYAPVIKDINNGIEITCNKDDLYAITSGCIFDLKKVVDIGYFNEEFFIDEVDNDYCMRCLLKGYHIKICRSNFLYQQFGNSKGSPFISRFTSYYSSFRTFYQVRNRIWMFKLYGCKLPYKYHAWTFFITILSRAIVVVLFENKKMEKLNAIIKGIYYGLTKSPQK